MLSKLGLLPKGHPLDLPNAAFGLLFYICALAHWNFSFLSRSIRAFVMLIAALVAAASSAWLAYALTYVLRDVCVVCVSTYVVNTAILVSAIVNAVQLAASKTHTKVA